MLDIPTISGGIIRGLYAVAVPIAIVVAAFMLHARFGAGPAGRARWRVGLRGLTPVSSRNRVKQVAAGTLVPLLAATALIVSLSIEREVRTGPNRTIDTLASSVSDDGELYWVLQQGTEHLMNDSRISQNLITALVAASEAAPGVMGVQPFWAQLVLLEHDGRTLTGFLFAANGEGGSPSPLSPSVRSGHSCSLEAGRCNLADNQVIVDPGEGLAIGESLTVRGQHLEVVAHTDRPRSLLNRLVLFTTLKDYGRVAGTEVPDAYGLLVLARDRASVLDLVDTAGAADVVEVLSTEELRDENSRFWTGNGTLIVLLLVLIIISFSAAALFSARRAEQQRAIVTQGILRSLALSPGEAAHVDLLRSWIIAVKAIPLAVPAVFVLIRATNVAVVGFRAELTVLMVFAAASLILIASGLSAILAARSFHRLAPVDLLTERLATPESRSIRNAQ